MDPAPCPCCGGEMRVLEEDDRRIKVICASCQMTDVKLKGQAGR